MERGPMKMLLHNKSENGWMLMLHQALGIDQEGESPAEKKGAGGAQTRASGARDPSGGGAGGDDGAGASYGSSSGRRVIPKVQGTVYAGVVVSGEHLVCYLEGMILFLVASSALKQAADAVYPRGAPCLPGEVEGTGALWCAAKRDIGLMVAGVLSVMLMAGGLSLRYSAFFAAPPWAILRGMAGPRHRRLSGTVWVACGALLLGFLFQVWGQRVFGRRLFGWGNYLDEGGGWSASRGLDIVVMAPIREEVVWRYFGLHIARNRLAPLPSVGVCGAFFGLVHLANARQARFSQSYVYLQVLQASLIGSFLSSRMIISGAQSGLWEPLLIHSLNNLLSSALPSTTVIDVSDPFIQCSIAMSLAAFSLLLLRDLRTIGRV